MRFADLKQRGSRQSDHYNRAPRFIADADLSEKIIVGVRHREPRIDFLNASEGGTRGLSDPEVLALAAATGRVVVSSDQKTMPGHFRKFVEAHESPGLIIVRITIRWISTSD